MLPAEYENAQSDTYPTVYVLDGGGLYPLLAAYYRYLRFADEVPDLIIVGISYGADNFEDGNYRSTDYTAPSAEREYWGGAEAFQTFLRDQLLPHIEKHYRADPAQRIVFGQSLGGQFVLYSALTDPGLFWGRVASNPALHRNLSFFLKDAAIPRSASCRPRLFVASGTHDNPQFRGPATEWMSDWSARQNIPWVLETRDLEGHSHMSAPPEAFRQGLRWLFAEAPGAAGKEQAAQGE